MAINKITSPLSTGPSVFASPVIAQLAALLTDCNHGARISGGYVKAGSLWNIGGSMFLADSDTAITGTRSASTTGVKFTVSGDSATVSYGTDAVTWNGIYQGYYDTSGNYYYVGENKAGDIIIPLTTLSKTINTDNKNTSYSLFYEYKVNKSGYYRLHESLNITITNYLTTNTRINYCKLYINGSPIGSEHSISKDGTIGSTSGSFSDDAWFENGDLLQLYIYQSGLNTGAETMTVSCYTSFDNYGLTP